MSLTFDKLIQNYFFISSFFMASFDILSWPIASFFILSFFIESLAIPSLLMASLFMESLLILSCAWAIGLSAKSGRCDCSQNQRRFEFHIVPSSKVLTAHAVRMSYVYPTMYVTLPSATILTEREIYPPPTCNKFQGAHEYGYAMRGAPYVNAFRHHTGLCCEPIFRPPPKHLIVRLSSSYLLLKDAHPVPGECFPQ